MNTIGVLVPFRQQVAPPPSEQPMGRVAQKLTKQGTRVVFGNEFRDGMFNGFEVVEDSWNPVQVFKLDVIFDRFTRHQAPTFYEGLQREVGPAPVANGIAMNLLCRDKLRCQQVLETAGVRMPPVEYDPKQFESRLKSWGTAFLKPRYGQCGADVQQVSPGMTLPSHGAPMADGGLEPFVLQAAVEPPKGWAGMSLRILTQRGAGGDWMTNPAVLRRSVSDPVANVSRGAEAVPAEDVLSEALLVESAQLARRACELLSAQPGGDWFIDAGVDLVVGRDGHAYLIEVNSRPWGRIRALAEGWPARFQSVHEAACRRPLEHLAWRLKVA